MHIKLEDQDTGATLTLCVERHTQTCTVLKGAEEMLSRALQMAMYLKTPAIRIIVDPEAVQYFEQHGWQQTGLVVMEQRFNNGKGNHYEQTAESIVRQVPSTE